MKNLWKFTVVLVVAFGVATAAQAIPIVQHVGMTDPETEGWSSGQGSPGYPDTVDGRDCWHFDPGDKGIWEYTGPLAASGLYGQDWTLSFDMWVADNMQYGELVVVDVFYATGLGSIWWGTGDPTQQQIPVTQEEANLWGTRTALGGAQVGWHEYAISWDESEGMVTYSIDAATVLTTTLYPADGPDDRVAWGNWPNYTSECAVSHLELVPEPATLCLLGLGGLALLRRRR